MAKGSAAAAATVAAKAPAPAQVAAPAAATPTPSQATVSRAAVDQKLENLEKGKQSRLERAKAAAKAKAATAETAAAKPTTDPGVDARLERLARKAEKQAPPAPDTPKPDPEPTPEERREITKQFIAARKRLQAAAAREKELEARAAELEGKQKSFGEIEAKLAGKDPEAIFGFLRERGLSAREIIARAAAEKDEPQRQPEPDLSKHLDPIRAEIEALRKEREAEREQLGRQQDLAILAQRISPDEHPYVSDEPREQVYEAVMAIYQDEYAPFQKPLDLGKILAKIESNLAGFYEGKFAKLKKQPEPHVSRVADEKAPGKSMPTITALDASPAVTHESRGKPLPWNERRAQLLQRHRAR